VIERHLLERPAFVVAVVDLAAVRADRREHATELLAEACVALKLETTTEELAHTMHAHPTLSEIVKEAAEATLGHAIHI